jgi:hypothetical protein
MAKVVSKEYEMLITGKVHRSDSSTKTIWRRISSGFSLGECSEQSAQDVAIQQAAQIEYEKCKRTKSESLVGAGMENRRLLTLTAIANEYPMGIPRLAALQSSDDDLAIFRRFDQVRFRLLLQLEIEMTELEKELFDLDHKDAVDPNRNHRLIRTKHLNGWDNTQRELLDKVRNKLKEYGEGTKCCLPSRWCGVYG